MNRFWKHIDYNIEGEIMEKNSYSMDHTFLKRAEQFTAFNLYSKDLTTVKYKNEVRHLILNHWFPEVDKSKVFHYNLNKENVNKSVQKLKETNKEGFQRLYSYNMKGIGPGEVMLYYMIDDAIIGGGSSAGVDLTVNSVNYEIKAVKIVKNKVLEGQFLSDFKLGGTVNLTEIIQGLQEIGEVDTTELSGSKVNDIRDNQEFKKLESLYREKASEYFSDHNIIFVNNSTKYTGEIVNIGKVASENIYIERMTSGTVKPLIKIT